MTFDPITFSAVQKLRDTVGAVKLFASNSQPDDYVASGTVFDSDVYPKLEEAYPGGFQGIQFSETTIPDSPSILSACGNALASCAVSYESEGKYYFIFQNSQGSNPILVYRSKSGYDLSQGIEFYKELKLPHDLATFNLRISLVDQKLYIGCGTSGAFRYFCYDSADSTLSTYTELIFPAATTVFNFIKGNGILLATSANGNLSIAGTMYRSTDDGASWTAGPTIAAVNSGMKIAFGAGLFVMVSPATTVANVWRSADGVTWTASLVGNVGHASIARNDVLGMFITGPFNTGPYQTSADGITWTARTSSGGSGSHKIKSNDAGAVIIGSWAIWSSGVINVSTNGTAYTAKHTTAPFLATLDNPTTAGGTQVEAIGPYLIVFCAANARTFSQFVYSYSTDGGVTWASAIPLPPTSRAKKYRAPAVASNGTIMLLEQFTIGTTATNTFSWTGVRSTDGGNTWNDVSIDTPYLVSWHHIMTSEDNKFIAWGTTSASTLAAGTLVTGYSTDGLTWTFTSTPSIAGPTNMVISSDNVMMVITGSSFNIWTSVDFGVTWVARSSSVVATTRLATLKKMFLMLNVTGTSYVSITNGVSWLTCQGATVAGAVISSVVSNNKYVVATLSNSSTCLYTTDGLNWKTSLLPYPSAGVGAGFIKEWFFIPSGVGTAYRTKDFVSWELVSFGDFDKYLGKGFTSVASSPDCNIGFISGPDQGVLDGYILKADHTVNKNRRIDFIPSTVPNTKWMVKAK